MSSLSNDVLMIIFTHLTPKTLTLCRIVCLRWKHVIENLTRNEVLWRGYCRTDFPDIYDYAYSVKAKDMTWYLLYRSLTLWPKISKAQTIMTEFAVAKNNADNINICQVQRDGVIVVHRNKAIEYYDIETLQQLRRISITNDYVMFKETDELKMIIDCNKNLFVTLKSSNTTYTYNDVGVCLLLDNVFYYVTRDNQIYLCEMVNNQITSTMIIHVKDQVDALRLHFGDLYIKTSTNIFKLKDGKLVSVDEITPEEDSVFKVLRKHAFISQINLWTPCRLRPDDDESDYNTLSYEKLRLHSYGRLIFLTSDMGILLIYHPKPDCGLSDLLKSMPLVYYSFLQRDSIRQLLNSSIIGLNIIEGHDINIVLVAFPNRMIIIKFIHQIERSSALSLNSKTTTTSSIVGPLLSTGHPHYLPLSNEVPEAYKSK